ncbi:MAG: DNA-binding protein [Candidatus Methanofastidiosum methylothiophilum]|uniref:DNA-binding protein n=1 Tax=Candidatus Methanofastidiosum methylothiophilum TaxID=1705564 RepID=A0A150J1I0_9EURY|nr:MAG: DNA-binding protein [Candidatus Methanofastidiosum methylthiophilus]NMC76665.1 DNA-binding protein [Candidatus Methanofastidiosa archaeon]
MSDDVEAIRKKKIEELQQKALADEQARQQKIEFELQKQQILRALLTSEARERLTRVKMARKEEAEQIELLLIQLYQAGKITKQVDDAMLKQILEKALLSNKKEFKIRRI